MFAIKIHQIVSHIIVITIPNLNIIKNNKNYNDTINYHTSAYPRFPLP